MTIAYWCVLIAAFMPLLFTGIAKFSGPGFNNFKPRDFQAKLEGARLRAHWAHLNSFEAFPPFAAAVIIAHQLQFNQARLDQLAIGFILFRLVYGALYIANRASLRSLAWALATASWVMMFFIGQ
ncbi:MAG: hypothetical protein COS34_03690 [Lysobacterales bacterium CG02_land_8_20_14_3_00_62_12]|nr:MAG: hypothetical protein COS34_03690 [Xanthomonadales bacterium CG02_land_8_20_14_3_00_62_12]PJA38847.1 MAG: hypothetical protein CO182_10110 [Xanthomonadales bacterium CG_4_9_14_3_um_filter_62_6]